MENITKIRILNRLGLFNHARDFYYRLKYPIKGMQNFFRQFIQPGDLCFDVGANIGQKTDIFLSCGAKVIVIEPQRGCIQYLRMKYRKNKNVIIVDKALDAQEGSQEFYICEANAISTMSRAWIQKTQQTGRYSQFRWENPVKVETTTLNQLISEYGIPQFCKIDVEGYELQVIRGLSQPIPYISIEIAPESIQVVRECLTYLGKLGKIRLNFSSNSLNFLFPAWKTKEEMVNFLENSKNKLFGDTYILTNKNLE